MHPVVSIGQHGLTPRVMHEIDVALKELKDGLAGTDIDAVKRAHENLNVALQDFSQKLYAAAQASQAAGGASDPGASAPNDDEVADAEIVDEPGEETA